ncbi:Rrt6p LALA0_S03e03774g [Lachancea lanzarotensis]|uniref:LALA0S03e03774g1_1 n=1 Tax=Lachancea lanzarotensis TaxID=1245769 RepID=A0A0C7N0K2_9SACH|nr:uncharacterized protein LALA0_S03e03774g [Lachancea lanzarotensis]CEP61479.1 LALA0S03e03774g1_1 [Lachancea lanzarotensis]
MESYWVNATIQIKKSSFHSMKKCAIISALCSAALAVADISQELLPQPQLSFVCPPIKASLLKTQEYRENYTCISFDARESTTSTVTFSIMVTEFLDSKQDLGRFGLTSCELGRQHLEFTITAPNGELLRSHRDLKSGRTVVQLRRIVSGSNFEFCFLNIVYDASWRSIDTHKAITLSVVNQDTSKPHISNRLTEDAVNALKNSANILFSLVNEESGQELGKLEIQRRDINENTFSWLLTAQCTLLLVIVFVTLLCAHSLSSKRWRMMTSSSQKCS